jgi:hypothetical protein
VTGGRPGGSDVALEERVTIDELGYADDRV